jgi:hypothetical protein
MRRALAAAILALAVGSPAAAQEQVPQGEWCRSFIGTYEAYWPLGSEDPQTDWAAAVQPYIDAVTDADITACQSALNLLLMDGSVPDDGGIGAYALSLEPAGGAAGTDEVPDTTSAEAVHLKGKNAKTTEPFTLAGGDYEVAIKVSGSARGGDHDCVDEGLVTVYVVPNGEGFGESFSQSGYLYGVEPGGYHLEVNTVDWCKWDVTITPLEA